MKISVAMCTYNGARFLSEQLESIAAQTRHVNELVICDDGSADDTCRIVDDFSQNHPGLVRFYCNPVRLGYSRNFAQALSLCKADLIFFSDQDDVWFPTRIERCAALFATYADCDLVSVAASVTDERLVPTGKSLAPFRLLTARRFVDRFRTSFAYGCTLGLRASLLPLILPISINWSHDNWICFLAGILSQTMAIDEPLMLYRRHPASAGANDRLDFCGSKQLLLAMRRSNSTDYRRDYEAWLAMCAHLERVLEPGFTQSLSEKVRTRSAAVLADVRARVEFSLARLQITAKPRRSRLIPALHMLTSGRYGEFVTGWRSFMKDLLTA